LAPLPRGSGEPVFSLSEVAARAAVFVVSGPHRVASRFSAALAGER